MEHCSAGVAYVALTFRHIEMATEVILLAEMCVVGLECVCLTLHEITTSHEEMHVFCLLFMSMLGFLSTGPKMFLHVVSSSLRF